MLSLVGRWPSTPPRPVVAAPGGRRPVLLASAGPATIVVVVAKANVSLPALRPRAGDGLAGTRQLQGVGDGVGGLVTARARLSRGRVERRRRHAEQCRELSRAAMRSRCRRRSGSGRPTAAARGSGAAGRKQRPSRRARSHCCRSARRPGGAFGRLRPAPPGAAGRRLAGGAPYERVVDGIAAVELGVDERATPVGRGRRSGRSSRPGWRPGRRWERREGGLIRCIVSSR